MLGLAHPWLETAPASFPSVWGDVDGLLACVRWIQPQHLGTRQALTLSLRHLQRSSRHVILQFKDGGSSTCELKLIF